MLCFSDLAAPPVFSIMEMFCPVQEKKSAFVVSLDIIGERLCVMAGFSMLTIAFAQLLVLTY